jgi:uncharacterized membrane protein
MTKNNKTTKRPGLAFLGWAGCTAAAATVTYFLLKDANHLIDLANNDQNLSSYVQVHLRLVAAVELTLSIVGAIATLGSAYSSLNGLYRVAERHFDNKRLAQPNA